MSAFLDAYLGTGDSPSPFCGREEDVEALREFLERGGGPPRLLLTAPLGRGKSALLVRLAYELAAEDDAAVVLLPVSLRFDLAQERRLIEALLARLLRLHDRPIGRWQHDSTMELCRRACDLLEEPLPDGRDLVLLLDGVDEAEGFRIGAGFLPARCPEHLRIVVSARAGPDGSDGAARALGWDRPDAAERRSLPSLETADIEDILRRQDEPIARLADHPDAVLQLAQLVEGDPLALWLHLGDLQGDAAVQDVDAAIAWLENREPGLKGFFRSHWEHQKRQWGESAPLQQRAVEAVLRILAIAPFALGREEIAAVAAGEIAGDLELDEAIGALSRLIHGDSATGGYVLAHPGLALYLRDDVLTRPTRERTRARLVDYVRGVVADVASGRRAAGSTPRSVLRSAADCLREANAPPAEWVALASRPWIEAHAMQGLGYAPALADLRDVEGALDVLFDGARDDRDRSHSLIALVRCALARASVGSMGGLTEETVRLALEEGVWTAEEALVHVASAPTVGAGDCQGELLALLVPHLSKTQRAHLVPPLRALGRDQWGRAGTVLQAIEKAGGIEPVAEWVEAIRCEPSPGSRAVSLAGAAGCMDPGSEARRHLLDESLAIARREVTDPGARSAVLLAIAKVSPGPEGAARVREAFAAARTVPEADARNRAWRFVQILPLAAPNLASFVIEEIERATSRLDHQEALSLLEDACENGDARARERLRTSIEERCREPAALTDRLLAWGRYGHWLEPWAQRAMGDDLLDEIAGEGDESIRLQCLRRLCTGDFGRSPPPPLPVMPAARRLVAIARRFTLEEAQQSALTLLAFALPQDEIRAMAVQAIAEGTPDGEHRLRELVGRLPPEEVVDLVRTQPTASAVLRLELLTTAIRSQPPDTAALVDEVLSIAREIRTPQVRSGGLVRLMHIAPSDRTGAVAHELAATIDAIADRSARLRELEGLIGAFGADADEELTSAALGLIDDEPVAWRRVGELHWLLLRERGSGRPRILERLAAEAGALRPGNERSTAFLFVARAARPGSPLPRRAVEEILDARRLIGDATVRDNVLAAWLPAVSAARAAELVEAIERNPKADDRFHLAARYARSDERVAVRCWRIARDTMPHAASLRPDMLRSACLSNLLTVPGAPADPDAVSRLVEDALAALAHDLSRASAPEEAWLEDHLAYLRRDARDDVELAVPGIMTNLSARLSREQRARAFELVQSLRSTVARAQSLGALASSLPPAERPSVVDEILALEPSPRDLAVYHGDRHALRLAMVTAAAPLVDPARRRTLLDSVQTPESRLRRVGDSDLTKAEREALIREWLSQTDTGGHGGGQLVPLLATLPPPAQADGAAFIGEVLDALPPDEHPVLRFHVLRLDPVRRQDEAARCLRSALGHAEEVAETVRVAAAFLADGALDRMLSVVAEATRRGGSAPGDRRLTALVTLAEERLGRPDPPTTLLWRTLREVIALHAGSRRDLLATLESIAPLVALLGGSTTADAIVDELIRCGQDWP